MYVEEIPIRNCYFNGFGTFDPGDLDLWSNDPKFNRVSPPPRMDVWTKFEEGTRKVQVGQGVFKLLVGNGFGIFDPGDLDLWPNDPKINRVSPSPRMDVWTKFEEGR